MADQSISQLPVATTITGDELTVVVQNGITKQTQVSEIANAISPGRLIDYLYFDTGSDLIVVYTDTTTQNLGPIPGYIAAEINSVGHLILTNSDGGTTDAGSVFASLTQTIITATNETATLPNSQRLVAGNNISLTSGTNTLTIAASGSAGSLNDAGIGLIAKDTSTSVIARTLTSGSSGIAITNGNGQAGNPTVGLAGRIGDIEALTTSGLLVMQAGTDVINRVLVGTASQITVVDGDGLAGNPTVSIATNPVLPGTGSVTLPQGNTAARPGVLPGQIRFNTQLDVFEGQDNSGTWKTLALGGGVTSVGAGTGLSSDTTNPITSTGTLSISATGVTTGTYGSSTQVGQFTVNAQGQITTATNVNITPSSIGAISAVNGTANEITSSQVGTVVTLSLPTALTFTGKTVTGGTFNMTAATVGSDTVTTNTATQTLTNKTISGSSNTLSNIGNSSLTNSQITLGTTNIALGGTSLAPVGLTSVTVTQDPTTNFQLATKQYVDTIATTGIDYHQPVYVESPDSAGNLNATYNQPGGAGVGVGATLTNAGTQVALTIDGVLTTVGMRVLIYNQTNAVQNGVYTVTTVGSGSTNWVLTRATDADTYGVNDSNKLDQGSTFFVQAGTTGAGETYTCNTSGVIVFGTTPITFTQISSTQVYSAGTGLTLTGTQFSISNTAVTAGTYGTDARNITMTVNAQGQVTNMFDQPISIAPSQINATIPNSGLTNSSITINGSAISLGGSVSVGTVTSVAATAGTGISISGSPITTSGTLTITNTAPDQTVVLNNGTGISVTGTYPNFTITNTSPSSGGTVTSVSGTGTVSGISLSGTVTTSGSLTLGGTLDLSSPPTIGNTAPNTGKFTTFEATADSVFSSTGALLISKGTTGQQPGTPVTGMLRYNTTTAQFEGYSGSSPAWLPVGGSTISNDTATTSNLYPVFVNATSGTATTVYTSNAKYLYKPSTGDLQASQVIAANGFFVNPNALVTSYTIPASSNASTVGPFTVASGLTVTVSSGSRWVVL